MNPACRLLSAREWMCNDVAVWEPAWDGGLYQNTIFFKDVGERAANDPEGDSPYWPGMTNLQLAYYYAAVTNMFFPLNGWWHYFGGYPDEEGVPTGLRFVTDEYMTDFMQLGCAFETMRFVLDYEIVMCDEADVPWDDHLADITVPVLYIGPAGGAGDSGQHTLTLLGSTDVEILRPSLLEFELRNQDFGHIDIWTSPLAKELVWQPLHQWIVHHRDKGGDNTEYPLFAESVE